MWNVQNRDIYICVLCFVTQSCPTLCNPMNCSPPGSSLHGILQARILEWVAIPSSKIIFPTQGSNPGLLHWHVDSLPLAPPENPRSSVVLAFTFRSLIHFELIFKLDLRKSINHRLLLWTTTGLYSVPLFSHPSANQAWPCLASEIRRDRARSGWYGRRLFLCSMCSIFISTTLFWHGGFVENFKMGKCELSIFFFPCRTYLGYSKPGIFQYKF